MKKLFLILMLPVVFVMTGCSALSGNAGEVHIMSGGKMYDVASNVLYRGYGDRIINAGEEKSVGLLAAESGSAVPYSDDFAIYIQGDRKEDVLYSLYDEDFSELYSGKTECVTPVAEGKYYCVMKIVWGNNSSYSGYQYCFSFER